MVRRIVDSLRAQRVDVQTAADAGMLGRSDEEQLAYAASQQRVVVTANAGHFARLHRDALASEQPHAGIIIVHQHKLPIGEIIRRLLHLAQTRTSGQMRGALVYLSSAG